MKKNNNITGLDSFLMKTNFFHEWAIRKLCHHGNGAQSAGIFITILCFLYQVGYYIKDTDELRRKMLEATAGAFTGEELEKTIRLSLDIDLFNKELYESEHILTSKEIQKCYLASYPGRTKPVINSYNLIDNIEE